MGGIETGFRVKFRYSYQRRSASRNMYSAREHPEIIWDYLAAGRVLGTFSLSLEFKSVFLVSFPKKIPGKWRLIIDLSSSENASVNDGIESSLCLLTHCVC